MATIQNIAPTECVGNSLSKINNNFASLNTELTRVESFRVTTNNLSPVNSNNAKLIMSLNGQLTGARPGIDYLQASIEDRPGLVKVNESGTFVKAISSVDYYVPETVLTTSNTTVNGTLNVSGLSNMSSTTINGTLSVSSRLVFGNGGTKNDGTQSYVYGDFESSGKIFAAGNAVTSDARLKTNIETIYYPLQKVQQLRGVTFNWISDSAKDIGVIAQEVEHVIPEAIETVQADGEETKYVAYNKIIPLLIESIKALKAEVDYLRSKVDQT
jgi:hypothetical protein